MAFSRIVYIGQRRNVSGLAGYGLGDAQIDGQNRATNDIGVVLATYGNLSNAGQLTASYIQSAMNQIQGIVNTYAQQFGSTARGIAGKGTLQSFIDNQVFPQMRIDLQNASGNVPTTPASMDFNDTSVTNPFLPSPQQPTTININSPSAATPANMQPSASPGPPSGIEIPGTTVDVTATAPAWYENPTYLLLAGLGIAVFLGSKGSNR